MKKFIYIILGLSVTGAILSGILTHQHFFGESKLSSFFCGSDISNPCQALSLTKYSVLWNIPVALYGLFFYILIACITLVAGYAKGKYYNAYVAFLLPVSGLALVADIVLFIILISIKIFCPLCILTYVANISLFITIVLWYMNISKSEKSGIIIFYKDVIDYFRSTSDSRAALLLFMLFTVFLALSLFTVSHKIELKESDTKLSYEKIKKHIDQYNSSPVENLNFPESKLIAGNPDAEVKIVVFTDFLCTYCYNFYEVEEYLLTKFKDKIKIEYHNFPLDQGCNKTIQKTMYNNSCIASTAMLASAEMNLFERYAVIHFFYYKQIKDAYDKDLAIRIFNTMGADVNTKKFTELMNSRLVAEVLENDIALASQYNIKSTPTVFIGNKRITGTRPKEVFEAIIEDLLK